ncbi:MAG TPA: hypothetical protein VHZ29_12735 [Rhizomicrobium sp.]|nr:hypothetical protein [Rhizomicrobium sp.]
MEKIALTAAIVAAASFSSAASAGERLVVAPYPAATPWKNITDKHNAQQLLMEWIPADQSENDIKDILTEQAFYNQKNADPSVFVGDFLRRVGGACQSARVNGPKAASENGYRVAYAQAYCVNQTGAALDVDIFFKAIAGRDALYVVQREFHRPTEKGAVAGVRSASLDQIKAEVAADKFLVSQVQLCPPASGKGACPAGK